MTPLSLQFALHGAVLLMAGLAGGLFFARAIKQRRGEVAWRVVHAGGCAAGVMLLAIAVPSQWLDLGPAAKIALAIGLIGGSYVLCLGMYMAAIWGTRGIPGGGSVLNRLVSGLYGVGTVMALVGNALLIISLLRSATQVSVGGAFS